LVPTLTFMIQSTLRVQNSQYKNERSILNSHNLWHTCIFPDVTTLNYIRRIFFDPRSYGYKVHSYTIKKFHSQHQLFTICMKERKRYWVSVDATSNATAEDSGNDVEQLCATKKQGHLCLEEFQFNPPNISADQAIKLSLSKTLQTLSIMSLNLCLLVITKICSVVVIAFCALTTYNL